MQFLSARDQGWWLTGALLGVSLALAAWVNLALPGSYLAPSLYAIPMLVAARRASVRRAVLIAVATQALYVASALARGLPPAVTVASVFGLLAVAGLAIELARHRVDALRRADVAEEADAESRRILESISDGFSALDAEWRFTYVNRQAEVLLRARREELLGRHLLDAFPRARGTIVEREIRHAFDRRTTRRFEAYYPSFKIWFDVRIFPAESGITVYFSDVTERRRAKKARREADAVRAAATQRVTFLAEMSRELAAVEPNYAAMLQRVADLAVPKLGDWCLVYLADPVHGFRRVAVAQADPDLAPVAAELRAMEVPAATQAFLRQLASDRVPYIGSDTEWTAVRRGLPPEQDPLAQSIRVSSFVAAPLTPRDRMLGAIIWLRQEGSPAYEATETAFLEEVARRCALSLDNARLYQEAREALRARDEFLSVAAHELRTPLTSIKGYIQLLDRRLGADQPDVDRLRASMEKLRPQLVRFERIVRDLLDISRIDQGNLSLGREPCDLSALAREIFDAVAHSADHDPAQPMRLSVPDRLWGMWDATRLTQVLANLLSNALKFSAGRGEIVMEVRCEGPNAVITVRDEGVGMTAEERMRVFEPFFRSDSVVGHIPGTGLGLHIAKRIVELHGGSIAVESAPGVGSTFTIHLPLAIPERHPAVTPDPAAVTSHTG